MLSHMGRITAKQSRTLSQLSEVASFRRSIASSPNSSVFRQWPTPKVTANGDYRDEAWLEQHIGGPLYEHQTSLPRLPVPNIAETLQRFLPTALPLVRDDAEAYALQQAVNTFPQQAAVLQDRLLERSKTYHDSSWLQHWWNTMGYLQVRDPVTVNVSYFFQFADDPTVTPMTAHDTTHSPVSPNTQRGAALLTAAAHHRRRVCSGQFPAERIGRKGSEKMLCSVAMKYLFHACRIPQLQQDAVKLYDPAQHNHVIVARNGQFVAMDFCCPTTGLPFAPHVLQQGLQECIELADSLANSNYPELGWLTSSNRDDWARARQALLQHGGEHMQRALELLQSGALLLCLDDVAVFGRNECAEWCLHGGLSSGKNRWFDKSVQILCTDTGKAAFMGEHSLMDGMPVVALADVLTKTTWKSCVEAARSTEAVSTLPDSCAVRPVFADAFAAMQTQHIEPFIQKAKQDFIDLAASHEISVQSFWGYGSDYMKKIGYSPDAFVQMIMQLATYRLWGEQAGTYEASQVRPFLHGRTETTRSVSPESAAFVHCMGLRPLSDEDNVDRRREKLEKLQAAVNAHVKYIGNAALAKGVDRHFLGLSLLVKDNETVPDLYSDPVFMRAKRWRVSTSHLTHPKFENWGYGEVVPDGVGLAYSIHPRHCVFNITALKEHCWTGKLAQLLEEALLEVRTLTELENAAKTMQQSKL